MSNTQAYFGLKPIRAQSGCTDINDSPYTIASGESSGFAYGDPVKRTGTGTNIALCGPTEVPTGIFLGCRYVNTQNQTVNSGYWPAGTTTFDGTDAFALVADDPGIIMEIQFDTLAKADIGQLANWAAGSIDTLNKRSGAYGDHGSLASSGKMLRIIDISKRINNDYGAYCVAEVKFAAHTLMGVSSGVGGV